MFYYKRIREDDTGKRQVSFIKKSVLQPCQKKQFLGMEINSVDITNSYSTREKGPDKKKSVRIFCESSSNTRIDATTQAQDVN